MYKTVVKLFSKLQNIKSMEYYSAIKIIIMKTLKNKEKCFHYDVKRKKLNYNTWYIMIASVSKYVCEQEKNVHNRVMLVWWTNGGFIFFFKIGLKK